MSGGGLVNKYQNKTSMQSGTLVAPKELGAEMKQTAAPAGRNPSYTPANTRMPITEQNPQIELKLANTYGQFNDFYRGGIFIKVKLTHTDPTPGVYIRPSNLISNMIERFELLDGNTSVEDQTYYGEKYTLDYFLEREEQTKSTSGFAFYGEGSQADRNARHVQTGLPGSGTSESFEYKLPITSEALAKKHAFPNFEPFVKCNDNLIMRWTIGKGSKWIETNAAPGTYSWEITQWDLYKDNIDVADPTKYMNMMSDKNMSMSAIKSSWQCDDVMTQDLGTNTKQSVQIGQKKSSIQGILVTVRKSGDVYDPTVNDKFETWYGPQHESAPLVLSNTFPLISYQWRQDSKPWPERPIKSTGPYAIEAYRWLALWKNHDHGQGKLEEIFDISGPDFAKDKFIMVFDARTWPTLGEIYNNFTTVKSNTDLTLELEFSQPPAPGLQLVIHTIHDKDWYFGFPGGGKVVY